MLHEKQGNYEEAEALALVSAQIADEDLSLKHQWTRNVILVLMGNHKKWGKRAEGQAARQTIPSKVAPGA